MMAGPENERIAFLRRLRAVRSFEPGRIDNAVVEDILSVARWTGSAGNAQEWQLVVVTDRHALSGLSRCSHSAGHIARAALAIAIVMPGERKIMEAFDEGRLAERIMLAALAHGLGSSIAWVTEEEAQAKALLGVPSGMKLRTVVSIGIPDAAARRPKAARGTARKGLEEIVHRERWGTR